MPRIVSSADRDAVYQMLYQKYIDAGYTHEVAHQMATHAADQRSGYYGVKVRTNLNNSVEDEFTPDKYITEALGGLIGSLAPSQMQTSVTTPALQPNSPQTSGNEEPEKGKSKSVTASTTNKSGHSGNPFKGNVRIAPKIQRAAPTSTAEPGLNSSQDFSYLRKMMSIEEEFGIK